MSNLLPAPEGVVTEVVAEAAPLRHIQVSKATRLADLMDEYVFYSVGLITQHTKLDVDPVRHYFETHSIPREDWPIVFASPAAFVETKIVEDWTYRIEMVPKSVWPGLFDALQTLAMIHRDSGYFARVLPSTIRIHDVLDSPSSWATRKIPLTVFNVDSTLGRWRIIEPINVRQRPFVKHAIASQETIAFAKALVSTDVSIDKMPEFTSG
jgi:hypothetical protein